MHMASRVLSTPGPVSAIALAIALSIAMLIAAGPASSTARAEVQSILLPLEVSGEGGKAAALEKTVFIDEVAHRLLLEPHDVRSERFEVRVPDGRGGLRSVPAPAPRTLRGVVVGHPDSLVAASLERDGLYACITFGAGERFQLAPVRRGVDRGAGPHEDASTTVEHVLFRPEDVADQDDRPLCGVGTLLPGDPIEIPDASSGRGSGHAGNASPGTRPGTVRSPAPGAGPVSAPGPVPAPAGSGAGAGGVVYVTEIACDTDAAFVDFNGSVAATVAAIERTINEVDLIFERDLETRYRITTIVVRDAGDDPFGGTADSSVLLNALRGVWRTELAGVRRDLVQLFLGGPLDVRGLAWLGSVCGSFGYSLLDGTDVVPGFVSGHELGHNWNAPHCTGSDCFIMCAGSCPGGRQFGPGSQAIIRSYRQTVLGCLEIAPPDLTLPWQETFDGSTLDPDTWHASRGATVETSPAEGSSTPFALALRREVDVDARDPLATTRTLPLDGLPGRAFLSYRLAAAGFESSDRVVLEGRSPLHDWNAIDTVLSGDLSPDHMKPFFAPVGLGEAHPRFRLRIRAVTDDADDEVWFDDVSIRVTDVEADLRPWMSAVQAGNRYRFDASVENVTGAPLSAEAWIDVFRPDGSPLFGIGNPKFGPKTVSLAAGETKSKNVRMRVPPSTEPATGYRIVVFTGRFPDDIRHADEAFFQVTAP